MRVLEPERKDRTKEDMIRVNRFGFVWQWRGKNEEED